MEPNNLDVLVENLLSLQPVFRKTMSKLEKCDDEFMSLTLRHISILFVLEKAESLPVSEAGSKLNISKPQMTILTDKLIEKHLIERVQDKKDRRIINISITDEGTGLLAEFKAMVKDNIKEKLSSLDNKDLNELSDALDKVKSILSKALDIKE